MSTKPIICARCRAQVTVAADPKPDDPVTCPSCGESDTYKNVLASLQEQLRDYAARELNKSLGRLASDKVTVTPFTVSPKAHRFIIELG